MEELLEILNDIKDDADFEHCTTLIDDAVLDSFDILSIISALIIMTFRFQHLILYQQTSIVLLRYLQWYKDYKLNKFVSHFKKVRSMYEESIKTSCVSIGFDMFTDGYIISRDTKGI